MSSAFRALLCLVLGGCMSAGCTHHIKVGPPELPPAMAPPEPPSSIIAANIKASLEAVGPALDDAVPDSFNTGTYCTFPPIACVQAYLSREPFQISIQGNHLKLASMIHYQMDGNFLVVTGSCGRPDNPRRRANVGLETDLYWDPAWTLRLRDSKPAVSAVDRCKVTLANIDVTDKAVGALSAGVRSLPDRADQRLQELATTIRGRLATGWKSLNAPLSLAPDTWLLLRPSRMSVTPFSVTNETLDVNAALSARPQIYIGQAPPNEPGTDLPVLNVEQLNGDFHVAPTISVAFRVLNDALSRLLVGRSYRKKIPVFPDLVVTIRKTTVIGSADTIGIGVELDGNVQGTAWLVGRVKYQPASRVLVLTLVDFTLETRDVLVKVADWLVPQLVQDAINSLILTYEHDLGPMLDDAQQKLTGALNRDFGSGVRLSTTIDAVNVGNPYSQNETFSFQADMNGQSRITIGPATALPAGSEIRLVSVGFSTIGDDKDAEEPVDLWIERKNIADPVDVPGGAAREILAHRTVGISERWGDDETQGPYSLRIPPQARITDCRQVVLRMRKAPVGSTTGKGWNMEMTATASRADGQVVPAARSPREDWGDGHAYDRRFGLCGR